MTKIEPPASNDLAASGDGVPIDRQRLGRLLGLDDEAFINEMLSYFWDSVARSPDQMAAAIEAGDAKRLHELAHAAIDALVEAERIVMRAGPRPLISLDVMPILAAFCAPGHGLSILIAFVVLVRGYVNSVIIAQM